MNRSRVSDTAEYPVLPRYRNSLTAEDQLFNWPYESSAEDGPFLSTWGMVTEFERSCGLNAHPGAIRFLAYLNKANPNRPSVSTSWSPKCHNLLVGFG
jgi:hypothetical protein